MEVKVAAAAWKDTRARTRSNGCASPMGRKEKEMKDRVFRWIARKMPRRLQYFCAVNVANHATSGKYGGQIVPELSAMDALARWEE